MGRVSRLAASATGSYGYGRRMSYDLHGKHVLVTGASAGIGAALAEGFAKRGATVGICARRADKLQEVLERCRVHAPESRAWTIDLADLDGIVPFARRVAAELGGIDVLVNNAGIPKRKPVFALTPEIVDHVMQINYLSPVHLTLALLDEIVSRDGRLVYVSSVAARLSPPGESAYAASKAAISAWAECLQVDLRDTHVKLHVVYPGVIDTESVPPARQRSARRHRRRDAAGRRDGRAGADDDRTGSPRGRGARMVRRRSSPASTTTSPRSSTARSRLPVLSGDLAFRVAEEHTYAGRPSVFVSRYSSKPATPCSRPRPLSL